MPAWREARGEDALGAYLPRFHGSNNAVQTANRNRNRSKRLAGWLPLRRRRPKPAAMSDAKTPWPTEIRLKKDRLVLAVAFDDGVVYELPAEVLRGLSPSAEGQGHSPEQRV